MSGLSKQSPTITKPAPCPICGSEPSVVPVRGTSDGDESFVAIKCFGAAPFWHQSFAKGKTFKEAIEQWHAKYWSES